MKFGTYLGLTDPGVECLPGLWWHCIAQPLSKVRSLWSAVLVINIINIIYYFYFVFFSILTLVLLVLNNQGDDYADDYQFPYLVSDA